MLLSTLVGKMGKDGRLDFLYQHVNGRVGFMTVDECRSIPEILEDGRYRLHDAWRWTSGDRSSDRSMIEEVER